jgi:uncharacterized protein YidB (DUF937 family)
MAKGSPSMIALLGLLAVGGYQNREKLAELFANRSGSDPDGTGPDDRSPQDRDGGLMGSLRQMVGGTGTGGLMGGLSELFERFSNSQHQAKAQSWVDTGRNETLAPDELEQVLDDEMIAELTQKTGLSRSELLSRLSAVLPEAVDEVTPEGRLPSADEARSIY